MVRFEPRLEPDPKFTFFIAEKDHWLVVSLVGALTKDSIPGLRECSDQIKETSAKWVILNFRDVPAQIDSEVLGDFADLQKSIRDRVNVLMLCSLHPELKKTLLSQDVIKPDELANNLLEALSIISRLEEVAAA
jgi:anti-anti-sigma regulatory factor